MTDRIGCCIPGCGRTFKREAFDAPDVTVMCGKHWRMGDQTLRDRHKRLRKRSRWFQRKWKFRQSAIEKAGRADKFHATWYRADMASHEVWHRVREDVTIKAALGAEDAPRRRPRHAA